MSDINSICLNMIVKNEAHVIRETLENLCSYINFSYYVISDTGSTDNTIQIIKDFFNAKKIKGEIYEDEWKDFGFNRSLALKYAYKKSKYILIFDADDKMYGTFKMPVLTHDSYYFKFGSGVTYKRMLLVNNQLQWNFVGVLHEYINCIDKPNKSECSLEGDYFVESGKTGSRSIDPQKYHKDAIVLEKAFYEEEKKNSHLRIRYSFYCAQSYRDSNQKEKAIEWYKKRIAFKDWEQEVYFSYFSIGKLYTELNEPEKAFYYWTLAFETDKERYESVYEIISYLRKRGDYNLAYQYYLMVRPNNIIVKPDLNNKLFACYPVYSFLLDYEMSIIFFNIKQYDEGIKLHNRLFITNGIPLDIKISILDNFMFYLNYVKYDLNLIENYFSFINNIYLQTGKFIDKHYSDMNTVIQKFTGFFNNPKKSLKNKDILVNATKDSKINVFFSITTCKRYDLFLKTMNSFLNCCKDINLIDYFFCVDDNSSHEDKKNMLENYPFFKFHFKKEAEKGHLISMNIIWNKLNELKPKYWIHLEDDWLFIKPCNYVKKSIDFLEKHGKNNIHQILFNKNYAEIINDYSFVGGTKMDTNYLLHIKDEPNLVGKNCAYWPHYSFRPSMCIVDTILNLGNYDSVNSFFEMDYATKYYNKGYKSAFYDEITCLHTGKLTSETNSDKQNAYYLNGVPQFGDKDFAVSKNKKICNYIVIEKVNPTINTTIIKQIFMNNNFGSRKSIIYNLVQHYNVWNKLVIDDNYNYYSILDSSLNIESIKKNIDSIINNNNYDVIFLDSTASEINSDKIDFIKLNLPLQVQGVKKEIIKNYNNNYIINKNSVLKILNYIEINEIVEPTLFELFSKIDNFSIVQLNKNIFDNSSLEITSDESQPNDECFDLKYLSQKNEYIFLKNKDHYGNDVINYSNLSVQKLMHICDSNENIIAFNTLGYLKDTVEVKSLIELNTGNDKDGIYINIEKYNKKYNNAIINHNDLISFPNKIIEGGISIENNLNESQESSLNKEQQLFKFINNNENCIAIQLRTGDEVARCVVGLRKSECDEVVSNDGTSKKSVNMSMLKDCNNTNTFIHLSRYVKTNYTEVDISDKKPFIKIIDKYIFFENLDNFGNDVEYKNNMSINEMIKYADDNNIIAFNTLGFFKNGNIYELSTNQYINQGNNGLFVRIDKLDNNKCFKIKNINSLDQDFAEKENRDNNSSHEMQKMQVSHHLDGIRKRGPNDSPHDVLKNSDYVAYHSSGYFKKNLTLSKPFYSPNIYDDYLLVNVQKVLKIDELKSDKMSPGVRVKVICDWSNSQDLCCKMNKMSMGLLKWNNLEFTHEDSFIDYYIIFNGLYEDTYYVPEKSILFITKPNFKYTILTHNFIEIREYNEYFNYFFWNIDKTYMELKYNILEKKYNKCFDWNLNNSMSHFKYVIAGTYEKLIDAIVSECLCFYYGPIDIFKYINKDVVIIISNDDINIKTNIINDAINNNIWEKKINIIKTEKNTIIDFYNIFPTVNNILEKKLHFV